jgi:hypothetical protein
MKMTRLILGSFKGSLPWVALVLSLVETGCFIFDIKGSLHRLEFDKQTCICENIEDGKQMCTCD